MKEFLLIWSRGNIGGAQMKNVFRRWLKFWRDTAGIPLPDDKEIKHLYGPIASLLPKAVTFDCDPSMASMISNMQAVLRGA